LFPNQSGLLTGGTSTVWLWAGYHIEAKTLLLLEEIGTYFENRNWLYEKAQKLTIRLTVILLFYKQPFFMNELDSYNHISRDNVEFFGYEPWPKRFSLH
jgi:hypothetical protein